MENGKIHVARLQNQLNILSELKKKKLKKNYGNEWVQYVRHT